MTQTAPMPMPAPALEPARGTPFQIYLAPEGVESSDGRLLEPGTTTWHEGPMPLMMQDTASHGPGVPAPSWFAGTIDQASRDDQGRIMGRGHLATGDDGRRAEQRIRDGLRSVSIDAYSDLPPSEQATLVSADGEPIKVLTRYADAHIRGATIVPIPAFENACIWLEGEPMPACLLAPQEQPAPASEAPPAVHARPAPPAALLASSGGPLNPPRAWFERPEADGYQPMTVTEDGAIYGHAARFGTCHIGLIGHCETAPRSATNYRYFHTDAVQTAEREVLGCGVLTLNTTHERNEYATARETMDHYDHTGLAVAKVRAHDGRHGIWVCGAVRPDLADEHLWALQGAKASGDWRDIRDQGQRFTRELVALLCVNTPGFPVPRPEVLVASGAIIEQLGELPCDTCDDEGAAMEIQQMGAGGSGGTTSTGAGDLARRVEALEHELGRLSTRSAPAIIASARERIAAKRHGAEPVPLELLTDESYERYLAMNRLALAKYDAATLRKMAANGQAMKDGGYPIADAEDLTNAIRAVGRGSGSHDAIRVHIMKRARALGKADAIPNNWNSDGSMKP